MPGLLCVVVEGGARLLELTALIAVKDRGRFSPVTAGWPLRYLEAVGEATIDETAHVGREPTGATRLFRQVPT
jgi:hypothetical protein